MEWEIEIQGSQMTFSELILMFLIPLKSSSMPPPLMNRYRGDKREQPNKQPANHPTNQPKQTTKPTK